MSSIKDIVNNLNNAKLDPSVGTFNLLLLVVLPATLIPHHA